MYPVVERKYVRLNHHTINKIFSAFPAGFAVGQTAHTPSPSPRYLFSCRIHHRSHISSKLDQNITVYCKQTASTGLKKF